MTKTPAWQRYELCFQLDETLVLSYQRCEKLLGGIVCDLSSSS